VQLRRRPVLCVRLLPHQLHPLHAVSEHLHTQRRTELLRGQPCREQQQWLWVSVAVALTSVDLSPCREQQQLSWVSVAVALTSDDLSPCREQWLWVLVVVVALMSVDLLPCRK
jgi:hypothetical protein